MKKMNPDELQAELLEHLRDEIGPLIGKVTIGQARAAILEAVGEWTIENMPRAVDPLLMTFDVRIDDSNEMLVNVSHPRWHGDVDALFLGRVEQFDLWAHGEIAEGELIRADAFELRFGEHERDQVTTKIDDADPTHPAHVEALARIARELH